MKALKPISLLIVFLMALALSACGSAPESAPSSQATDSSSTSQEVSQSSEPATDGKLVGISMPTKSSQRWIDDGNNMVKFFEEKGYQTDLQYAEDDIPNQLAQIENMVTKGVDVLVIAAIDGTTLSDVLQQAADKGILIIAYDRLIRDSENVDYYVTFDNFQVGVIQGSYIV
ncbi:MAG TPA: substrate-binding domain-containing protein, partial [Anaerolineae bacterium]|nr:substrate-binding domain-containing protein [Anaerolineae bacterium]